MVGFTDTKTEVDMYAGNLLYGDVDSDIIYDADRPTHLAWLDMVSQDQFEEKSIRRLERHLLFRAEIQRRVAQDLPSKTVGVFRQILQNGRAFGKDLMGRPTSSKQNLS